MAQLVAKNWEEVGIKTIVQIRERALHFQMRDSNDIQTEIWNEDTGGFPFTGAPKYDPRTSPGLALAPLMRQWYCHAAARKAWSRRPSLRRSSS